MRIVMKAATALCFVVLVCALYSLAQESAFAANSTGSINSPSVWRELGLAADGMVDCVGSGLEVTGPRPGLRNSETAVFYAGVPDERCWRAACS
jgi:hypothetical protein